MTGKKSLWMLFTILIVSFGFMVFIGGTEPQRPDKDISGDDVNTLEATEYTDVDAIEINITVSLKPVEFSKLKSINEDFMVENPNTNVRLTNRSESAYEETKMSLKSGQASDILMVDNAWIEEFAASGLLHPLDEVLKSDLQSRYFSQLMSQVKWNGYIWGLPKKMDSYIWVYKEQTIQSANLNELPYRLDDLLLLHYYLLNLEQETQTIYFDPFDPYALASFVSTMGADLDHVLQDEVLMEELERSISESMVAMDTIKENEVTGSDPWLQLEAGNIGMMISTVSEFQKHKEHGLAMAPMRWQEKTNPAEEHISGLVTGKSFVVPSLTEVKEKAFDWLEFISLSANQISSDSDQSLSARVDSYGFRSYQQLPYHEEVLLSFNNGLILTPSPYLQKEIQQLMESMIQIMTNKEDEINLTTFFAQVMDLVDTPDSQDTES